jgi:imidazoleglycerol phosphate dehydratase HisB
LWKAFARALDGATRIDDRLGTAIPSTKGTL